MKTAINNREIIKELEEAVAQKITFLKSLNIVYTSALNYLESEKNGDFLVELEDVEEIKRSIENIELRIQSISAEYEDKQGVDDLLSGKKDDFACPLHLKKLSDEVITSRKMLINLQMLNQKIIVCTEKKQNELRREMVSLKNRKKINTGYRLPMTPKAGLSINC